MVINILQITVRKNGKGFFSFNNGDNFEEELKNNKAVSGKVTYKDGRVYKVHCINDEYTIVK